MVILTHSQRFFFFSFFMRLYGFSLILSISILEILMHRLAEMYEWLSFLFTID